MESRRPPVRWRAGSGGEEGTPGVWQVHSVAGRHAGAGRTHSGAVTGRDLWGQTLVRWGPVPNSSGHTATNATGLRHPCHDVGDKCLIQGREREASLAETVERRPYVNQRRIVNDDITVVKLVRQLDRECVRILFVELCDIYRVKRVRRFLNPINRSRDSRISTAVYRVRVTVPIEGFSSLPSHRGVVGLRRP